MIKNFFLAMLMLAPVISEAQFITTGVHHDQFTFMLNGRPFYFSGTNAYWLMQKQAQHQERAYIVPFLQEAQALGFQVIRTWAFADGSQWTQPNDLAILQKSPGIYNEVAFQALDYVIDQASKKNIKLILVLTNYWDQFGGIQQYVRWAGLTDLNEFFKNVRVKQMFKNHLKNLLNRNNRYKNIMYKDDPTIFSWELCNEARMPQDATSGQTLRDWYQEMAQYIQSIDKNHLIATGEEGFDISQDQYSDQYSNTYPFQGTEGSSYRLNTAIPEIAYATAHLHPKNWGFVESMDSHQWIQDHIELSKQYEKPFVLGEYGAEVQSPVILDWLTTLSQSGGAGDLLWGFLPYHLPHGLTPDQSTIRYPSQAVLIGDISRHALEMKDKNQY